MEKKICRYVIGEFPDLRLARLRNWSRVLGHHAQRHEEGGVPAPSGDGRRDQGHPGQGDGRRKGPGDRLCDRYGRKSLLLLLFLLLLLLLLLLLRWCYVELVIGIVVVESKFKFVLDLEHSCLDSEFSELRQKDGIYLDEMVRNRLHYVVH